MTILGALGWFLLIFVVYPILCLIVIGFGVEAGFDEPSVFPTRGWALVLKIIGWSFVLPFLMIVACWWGAFLYGRYLFTGSDDDSYDMDIPRFIMEIWEW